MGLGQLHGFGEHAGAFLGSRCQHHPGTEKSQQLAPFHAETLGHGHHQGITLLGTDHGEADTGVAAGGFDHCLSGFELTGALGAFDDGAGHAVFDRPHGVERLYLHVDVGARRTELVQLDQRGYCQWCRGCCRNGP